LAIDISSFTDLAEFKRSVAGMCQSLRSRQPADGFKTVVIPGDRGHVKVREVKQRGEIDVADNVVEYLQKSDP
jgi:LDH2 family malate/lactate/ureidoglycolate dehydrogenase